MIEETSYDRHERHMKPIREAQTNKTIIPTEKWVALYGELSDFILEYSSLDSIWQTDSEGNPEAVRTEEKQDEFMDIVDIVEDIMRTSGLIKQGEENE